MAIDTLVIARRLTEAGLTREQAEAHAEVLRDVITGEAATKQDLRDAVRDLTHRFDTKVAELHTKIDVRIAELKAEMIKYMVGQTLAIAAIVFGLLRLVR
jgi:hypothetical protein